MTHKLAMSLLSAGTTGDQILQILDVISAPDSENIVETIVPTLDEIEF